MQQLDRLDDTRSISRREFTLEWAMAMLAGVAITISGCGSDSPSSPTPSTGGGGTTGDVTGVVSANHGHIATITSAQLAAGGTLNLNIMGNATHAHTVTLTGTQLQQIGAKAQVAVLSTTDAGHDHTVTFN